MARANSNFGPKQISKMLKKNFHLVIVIICVLIGLFVLSKKYSEHFTDRNDKGKISNHPISVSKLTNDTIIDAVKNYKSNRYNMEFKKYGHISRWDVSRVTNMNKLFQYRTDFNENIGDWDVSGVTNMYDMFAGATSFEGKGLKKWKTSKVTNMSNMFRKAESFNEDISVWDTSQVTTMNRMFHGAKIFNQH